MDVKETLVSAQEVKITPEAAEQIRQIRKENNVPEKHGLRIGIQSGGCCGTSYLLAFDEKADETDKVFQSEGISIFVDEESIVGLSGTTLEYIDGPEGKGFRFDNPNMAGSCNCGEGGCDDEECGGH